MKVWRQLRWQIAGSHLLVVVTGVIILLLTTEFLLRSVTPIAIQPRLIALTEAQGIAAIQQATLDLLKTFQETVLTSLFWAALGAFSAGLIASLFLSRTILRPLNQLAHSSQRIADGRYDERIAVPDSAELAAVATSFNEMTATLAQIEARRISLIGNVSHELRTPLTGLEGYLEGLMDGLFPSDTETFAQMYYEVRRLRRLVNDLQTLSRIEAGQIDLHPQQFDLLPLIKRVVAQLQPQAMDQSLELQIESPEQAVWIYADPDRTVQILINLIGNAIRYTPEAGHITIHTALKPPTVAITVQDTGLGIPPDALPYLFERFYRVDSSRSRRSGGSGIGLTISRHLARSMQGELVATSPGLDQGSTFTLTLPLAKNK
jgi:histidine kinase